MGEDGIGQNADRLGTTELQRAGITQELLSITERVNDSVEAGRRADRRTDIDGFSAVLIRTTYEHSALADLRSGLGTRGVGVGVHLRGLDDLVQPIRGNGVDQVRDPAIDVQGGFLGQTDAVTHDLARLPWRRLTGQDLDPGQGEPVTQCQGITDDSGTDAMGDTHDDRELTDRELQDLRAALATQHHATFTTLEPTATRPRRTRVGVETVGVDQGVFERPGIGPVRQRTLPDGRLQQVGRRQQRQIIIVEHAF
ncbi:hypothetical protein ACFVWG_21645 [Kribbella sp. NPDC058245]|uniref:hypothetical protein n=1 Tax=Kribbella sp. NPDC058245 TaxID=3346399 RepID=UPI0036F1431F